MRFDEETEKAFEDVLDRGNELVEEALAISVDDSIERKPVDPIEDLKDTIQKLKEIIDNRDHDIACLNSELRQALDDNAGLKDEIDILKRELP